MLRDRTKSMNNTWIMSELREIVTHGAEARSCVDGDGGLEAKDSEMGGGHEVETTVAGEELGGSAE